MARSERRRWDCDAAPALAHAVDLGLLDLEAAPDRRLEMALAMVRMPCPPTPARMMFCSTIDSFCRGRSAAGRLQLRPALFLA